MIASPGSAYMTGNTHIARDLTVDQTRVSSCQSWKASVFPRTSIISGNLRLSASPVRVPHHSKRTQVEHVTSEMNGPYGLPSKTVKMRLILPDPLWEAARCHHGHLGTSLPWTGHDTQPLCPSISPSL